MKLELIKKIIRKAILATITSNDDFSLTELEAFNAEYRTQLIEHDYEYLRGYMGELVAQKNAHAIEAMKCICKYAMM